MKQPTKRNNPKAQKKKATKPKKRQIKHPKYGTSKLEKDFAHDFLDKLGIEYQYQFEAKDIGRFYDFRIIPNGPIFEVNGSYWHSDPRLYEEKKLNKVQVKTKRIDEYKKKWALMHGIPIYYFWEKDIRENPSLVLEKIKKILYIEDNKKEKNKSHRKFL